MRQRCLVGRYTKAQGITAYQFDQGVMTKEWDSCPVMNPSYLYEKDDRIYAVLETQEYEGQHGGGVAAFQVEPDGLRLINTQPVLGVDPCHLLTSLDGKILLTANYTEGSFSCFPLDENGAIGPIVHQQFHHGKGIDPVRQEKPHIHFLAHTPDRKYICVVDLGCDAVVGYEAVTPWQAPWFKEVFRVNFIPGTGPRHMVFSPNGAFAYVVGELGNTVTVCRYLGEQGMEPIQVISTLDSSFTGESTCAAIKISADGKNLYVSNRGADTVTGYAVDEKTGELSCIQHISVGGKTPRDLSLDITEKYLSLIHI